MTQVQALQGYFRNGQFMSPQVVELPENVEVFITITGRKIPIENTDIKPVQQEELTLEQLEVAKNVLLGVERITSNGLSKETLESFESLERGDFKIKFEERLP
ncbi:MAG: hypothetical protein FWB80_08645 [Defluviitaleaceae bacterium]|nr:hypothetical protein [Defluviitaleaceae bacterium]